jgi:hypothetical protein
VDIARGEMVEGELARLIERHSRQKDPDEESELWKESVRAYEEQRQQMARLEWLRLSLQAARHRATLAALIEHHEGAAAKLMEDQTKGAA